MSDPFKLQIASEADLKGFDDFEQAYQKALAATKEILGGVLGDQGASPEFIEKAKAGIDEITAKLASAKGAANFAEVAADVQRMTAALQAAAEAEGLRIARAKQAQQVAAESARYEADDASRMRAMAQQRQLDAELEERSHRQRMAHAAAEIEMQRALAQAAQMRQEQQITSEVMGKGDYSPAEDVAAWKARESAVKATGAAAQMSGANAGLAALQLAQFVDDAQYGLRGVMNNIPGLVLAMGGSAGLAGAMSIALVAGTKLWEMFSGAQQAEKDTEAVKKRMEEVATAAEAAAESTASVFEADMSDYLDSLGEMTARWRESKSHISEALQYANEMAKAQQQIAEAAVEGQRVEALKGAKTKEQRDSINAAFDMQIAGIRRQGEAEARARAEAAQRATAITAQQQADATKAAAEAARNAGVANDQGIAAITGGGMGNLSDQAARERERMMLGADNASLDRTARQRELTAAERERALSNAKRMQELNVFAAGDASALKGNAPLTFEGAKKAAQEKGDSGSLAAITAAEKELETRLKERVKIAEEAAELEKKAHDAQIAANDEQQRLKLVQVKNAADTATSATKEMRDTEESQWKKAESKREAEERAAKQKAAEDKRAEREALRAQKERDAAANRNAGGAAAEAGSDAAGALRGQGLGAAADSLSRATEKLRDGATASEAAAAAKAVNDLVPMVSQFNAQTRKELSELAAAVKSLQAQFKNNPER